MTRYTGVNHLALVTGDMNATIRFWRDLLGMRLVAGLGQKGYRHYFFEISKDDLLAFFEWPGAEKLPEKDHGFPQKGPIAFDHVSIGVKSADDLYGLKAKLEAAGFWASEVMDHGFIHSIYAFDPNGVPIEFSYSLADVNIRKEPAMADSTPAKTAMEGPEPQAGHWPDPGHPEPPAERRVYPGQGKELLDPKKQRW